MPDTSEQLQTELQTYLDELQRMAQEFRTNEDTNGDDPFTQEERQLLLELQQDIDGLRQQIAQTSNNYVQTTLPDSSVPYNAPLASDVGTKRADNHPEDVRLVIGWLNNWGYSVASNASIDDVIEAIKQFQGEKLGFGRPDGNVGVGGRTWRVLSAPVTDLSTLEVGDNPTEQQLLAFQQNATYVGIRINPGEEPARYVEVTMPYVNSTKSKKTGEYTNRVYREGAVTRRNDPRGIAHLISGDDLSNAKVTPKGIQDFLEAAIAAGKIAADERTAQGLRNVLIEYAVGLDCNGLAFQALNHLNDGNYSYEPDTDPYEIGNANGLYSHQGGYESDQFDIITNPNQLQAGDLMYLHDGKDENDRTIYRHVRVLTDLDVVEGRILFATIESGSNNSIVDALYHADRAAGVGDQTWRYDLDSGELWNSPDDGATWSRDTKPYVYYRPK